MPVPTETVKTVLDAGSTTQNLPEDNYITLWGIDWETFEGIANRTRGGRLTYDGGELQIKSPSIRMKVSVDV